MINYFQARRIAGEWHGGQASALYALASAGALSPTRDDPDPGAALLSEIDEELATLNAAAHRAAPDVETLAGISELSRLRLWVVAAAAGEFGL